jgi:hypothetical protein
MPQMMQEKSCKYFQTAQCFRRMNTTEQTDQWRPIATAEKCPFAEIDVWLEIPSSLMTMGFGDSFRVTDVWFHDGKWVHMHGNVMKPLRTEYITHWMPRPEGPKCANQEAK